MRVAVLFLGYWLAGALVTFAQPTETTSSSRTVVTTATSPAAYKDRDAILDLLKRRIILLNDDRPDGLKDMFTAEAEILMGNQPRQSLAALSNAYRPQLSQLKLNSHKVRTLKLEDRNATATEVFGYSYTPANGQQKTGTGTITSTLFKGDDKRWRITRSQVTYTR